MKFIIGTIALLLFALALAGCGQSGKLYVPGDPSSIETAQPPPESDSDEDDDEEDDDSR